MFLIFLNQDECLDPGGLFLSTIFTVLHVSKLHSQAVSKCFQWSLNKHAYLLISPYYNIILMVPGEKDEAFPL